MIGHQQPTRGRRRRFREMARRIALTKSDMARVIVQALYAMPELPAADHPKVKRMERRSGKTALQRQHKLAVKIIQNGLERGTWPTAKKGERPHEYLGSTADQCKLCLRPQDHPIHRSEASHA